MERRVSVRDMRIEGDPRTAAVTSIDLAGVLAASADAKILSVGRGGRPSSPMAGKRQLMLMIYDFSEGLGVGLLTNMPSSQRVELVKSSSWTSFGHLCQAEVDRISQDHG